MKRLFLVPLFAALFGGLLPGANLVERKVLTFEGAKAIAAAAEAEAVKNNWHVVITILDEGGNLRLVQRMDEVQIGSIAISMQKAKSAFLFKRPTKSFQDAVAGGRTAVMRLPGAMPFEGGLPIEVDGQVVGAIGVSGMTSEQDAQIGRAGLAVLK
jgi:glc operon protein GlcG